MFACGCAAQKARGKVRGITRVPKHGELHKEVATGASGEYSKAEQRYREGRAG